MRVGRSFLMTTAWLITITLTGLGLFSGLAVSHESVEQERTLCMKECKDRYGIDTMWGGRGGGETSNWRLYFMCIDNCEKRFWKEWQKNTDEIDD
ncbi:MAG: hypothetical protein WCP72_02470 [Desulfomonile sp.]|jgi:hypothetical protein